MLVSLALLLTASVAEAKKLPLLLWEVERDGQVSHLFGTCHMPIALDEALPPPHDAQLREARALVVEANVRDIDFVSSFRGMSYTDGTRLSSKLAPEHFYALSSYAAAMPASTLDRLRPWGAYSLASVAANQGGVAMDLQVHARWTTPGREATYLETVDQQFALLSGLDHWFLPSIVPHSLEADDSLRARLAAAALCDRADIRPLSAMLKEYVEVMDPLFGARNRAWVPLLLPKLAEGGAFVAVGAGHMLGDDGLIALLTAEGYTVRRQKGERPPHLLPEAQREGFVLPDPTPFDAARVQNQLAALEPVLIEPMCSGADPNASCFLPSGPDCAPGLRRDTELCLATHDPAAWTDPNAYGQALVGCALSGYLIEAAISPTPHPEPTCAAVIEGARAEMEAAAKGAMK